MMIRTEIKNLIKKLVPKNKGFSIIYPPKKEYGDYSVFFPLEEAESLKKKIEKKKPDFLEKVEVLRPGFLNFYLKKEFLQERIREILEEGGDFGEVNVGEGKNTNIEFISANPTGELHIGNGRGAFFGDVLANVLKKAGYNVEREYYINNSENSVQIKELGKTAMGLGESYKTDYLKFKIKELESEIEKCKSESEAGRLLAEVIQKDNKKFIEKKLKIRFDHWFEEEKLFKGKKIEEALNFLKKTKLTYKKDGALWLKTSKFGVDKDKVIVRKTGEATYFLADIAYHKDKMERGYEKIIDIWGADHQGHIKRMEAAMEIMEYKGEFDVLISQIVRLKSGKKLSKRKGDIVKIEDLVCEVGLDVARFFYLSKSLSSQMEFDLDLAKEQSEKNPVYYIQYAHARICSVLRKSRIMNYELRITKKSKISNLKLINHQSEFDLIRELIKFPEIIEDTAKDYQLQRLPEYGKNLAGAFHKFYRDCRVLPATRRTCSGAGSEEEDLTETRLCLLLSVKITLSNLLSLMGISAPKKM